MINMHEPPPPCPSHVPLAHVIFTPPSLLQWKGAFRGYTKSDAFLITYNRVPVSFG